MPFRYVDVVTRMSVEVHYTIPEGYEKVALSTFRKPQPNEPYLYITNFPGEKPRASGLCLGTSTPEAYMLPPENYIILKKKEPVKRKVVTLTESHMGIPKKGEHYEYEGKIYCSSGLLANTHRVFSYEEHYEIMD